MTFDRDVEVLLDAWLADGPSQVADRVVDDVAARIAHQTQRPAWRLRTWRLPTMSTTVRLIVLTGALLALLLGGAVFLGAGSAPPAPPPTPTLTPAPTPIPSPVAVYPSWFTQQGDGAGILPAGSNTTRQFRSGSTFTVPDGWVNDGDYTPSYYLFPDTPANEAEYALSKDTAQNIILTDTIENNMVAICDAAGLFQGTTASEVIDWVVANEAFSTTEPIDVTIDGLSGQQVDLRLSADWTGSCPLSADDPPTRDYTDSRGRFIVLDTPDRGSIGTWIGSHYSADFEAFLADAMPIVESFQFALGPGASPS